MFNPIFAKTPESPTLWRSGQVHKPLPFLGVLVELWLVFPVSLVVEHTVLDKEPSVTCAVVDVCSPLLAPGEGGTERST